VGELVFCQDFLSVFKATCRFPYVVANGVSSAPFFMAHDCLYLVFFFAFDKVRRWFHEVGAVGLGLVIG